MSDTVQTKRQERGSARDGAASLSLLPEYAPDETAQARALLLIAGLTENEIERVVAELALDSESEM